MVYACPRPWGENYSTRGSSGIQPPRGLALARLHASAAHSHRNCGTNRLPAIVAECAGEDGLTPPGKMPAPAK